MRLEFIHLLPEATTEYVGPLHNFLGNGEDWTVNYGTGDMNRNPFLYIKVPFRLIKNAIAKLRDYVIWSGPGQSDGHCQETGRIPSWEKRHIRDSILRHYPNTVEIYFHPKLTHVGEAHITISMGRELETALDNIKRELGLLTEWSKQQLGYNVEVLKQLQIGGRPLFDDNGNGLETGWQIDKNEPFSVVRAGFYKDEVDVEGPLLVAFNVETDLYYKVREALGLPRQFTLPNGAVYVQHITIGYIPKRNIINKRFYQ